MGGGDAAGVAARKHRPAKRRRDRSRLSRGRRGNRACLEGGEVAIGVREGPSPHREPPPHRGRENSPHLPRRGREDLPLRFRGEKENSHGAGVAEVVAAVAVRGRAVRRIRAAAQRPVEVASSVELARNRMVRRGVAMSSDFSLFERHIDALYRSALRLTRKPEDAEDLVQETYLRAYRYRNRFKPGTNEKAWLFTIMTNVFRNRLRQRHAPEDPIDAPGTDFSIYDQLRREGMPVHLMSPEEIIVERGFGDEVKRALEELPVPMRMVVVLVDVEDFSYKEVASILGIKIGTVMSRLHRGRQALQKKLWEYSGRPKAPSLAVGAR